MDFLHAAAAHYVARLSPAEWRATTFVMPNTRAGVFFAEALSKCLPEGRVVFGLRATNFTDLVQRGNELRVPDALTLRCLLYEAWRSLPEPDEMPFERFYSWAGVILGDFDDIDKALASPATIFGNVDDYQRYADDLSHASPEQRRVIESFWQVHFDEAENSLGRPVKVHARFFQNYRRLARLYEAFNALLRARRMAYPGMLYRQAANTGGSYAAFDGPDERYAFVGLSLLSRAEQRVMANLQKAGRASFLWDYSPELLADLDDPHAPGRAVADHIKRFPPPSDFEPPAPAPDRQVRVFQTTYQLSQTTLLGELLRDDAVARQPRRAAIVLPDRSLLPQLLARLSPELAQGVNVTMGYSLRFAPVATLVRLLADLQDPRWQRRAPAAAPKSGSVDGTQTLFSHRLVRRLLTHPLVALMDGQEAARGTLRALIDENAYNVAPERLADTPFAASLLRAPQPEEYQHFVAQALAALLERLAGDPAQTLNRETTWEALKATRRLATVTSLVGARLADTHALALILAALVEQQDVDFDGMPLAGLQVMGVLETRGLDFDNVYALDMNEGNWPAAPDNTSLIPIVIRRANGLTTPDEVSVSLGYYFHRLAMRARRLTLLHPALAGTDNNATPSRYVTQMLLSGGPAVTRQVAVAPLKLTQPEASDIDKHTVAALLDAVDHVSPSALSDYLTCQKLFFFKHVARLSPLDEVAEEADQRLTGTIFHATLEELYGGHPNGFLLDEAAKKELLDNDAGIVDILLRQFARTLRDRHLRSPADLAGRNILTFNMLHRQVRRTIETEPPGITIVGTESRVSTTCHLAGGRDIKLVGTIDRLHRTPDGCTVVGDYKTGRVGDQKHGELLIGAIDDLFKPDRHDDLKAAFQTMTYCHVLADLDVFDHLTPYVIALSHLHDDPEGRKRYVRIGNDILRYEEPHGEQFASALAALLNEIFDPARPFEHTQDPKTCAHCDFRNICKR